MTHTETAFLNNENISHIVCFAGSHKAPSGIAFNTGLLVIMSETILHLDKHVLLCFDNPVDDTLIPGK